MKGKVKLTLVVAVLAAFVAAFAGEALAAKNPDWVKRSYTPSLVRNQNVNDINSPDYWYLRIVVTHQNNSSDRDITAFYDRDLTFTAKLATNRFEFPQYTTTQKHGATVSRKVTISSVSEVNVWGGRSHDLPYLFFIKTFITPSGGPNASTFGWKHLNEQLARLNGDAKLLFTNRQYTYNVHVRSKRSD
jgi:hypothetical protein